MDIKLFLLSLDLGVDAFRVKENAVLLPDVPCYFFLFSSIAFIIGFLPVKVTIKVTMKGAWHQDGETLSL